MSGGLPQNSFNAMTNTGGSAPAASPGANQSENPASLKIIRKNQSIYSEILHNPRNRKQNYCSAPDCQRARKAAWQRYKIKTDADYRTQEKLSHQKWLLNNPDYWKRYRQRNPDKAERNRTLQHLRNRRKRQCDHNRFPPSIAKMDARKPYNFDLIGQFYLVPVIAKMDASKVNIYTISNSCS
jgi:hypothetical protein